MLLTQKDIDELKEIYHAEYNLDLPDEKAWEMGNRLIRFYAIATEILELPDALDEKV